MLTFFRKIRKALLESGSTQKYLFYAIGEIALVVIGILIALQINNWNQQVQDRGKEKEYLTDIMKDLLAETLILNVVLAEVSKILDAVITLQSYRLSI